MGQSKEFPLQYVSFNHLALYLVHYIQKKKKQVNSIMAHHSSITNALKQLNPHVQ